MRKKKAIIDNCFDCPHSKSSRLVLCYRLNKIDISDKDKEIPENCPLEDT